MIRVQWGSKPTPVGWGLPPDLGAGLCVRHPHQEIWDANASPTATGTHINAAVAAAKTVCNTGAGGLPCPARDLCLQLAMADEGDLAGPARFGTRGGLDRYERADLAHATTTPGPPSVVTAAHGSSTAYAQHYRGDEPPCDICRVAYNARRARQRESRRAETTTSVP